MSNLFDLPPEEFSFYLEEGRYTPERRRELIEGYNAAFAARNARPPVPEGRALSRDLGILENARRLGLSVYDNVVGREDDYETAGERFGRGINETIAAFREDPRAMLGLVSEGIADSYRRAATLPSLDQIRAGEAPGAVDALGFAAVPAAPALGAARAANVLSANPVGRDVAGALDDLRKSREAMLSASNETPFDDLVRMSTEAAEARKRAVEALSTSEGGVRLMNPSNDRGVAVTPGLSGEEVGKFRLTFIDESRTPTNHVVYNTREEALEAALGAGFTQAPGPRPAASALQDFGFNRDNPGGSWLRGKQERAEEEMADTSTKSLTRRRGIVGSTTSTLGSRKDMFLPTDRLSGLTGLMDERRGPGDPQYDALFEKVRKEGFDPEQAGNKVVVAVNHRGEPYVLEGNTRIAVARDLGIPNVRVEVRYWNGGEEVDGPFAPENVAGIASLTPRAAALPSEGIRVFHASPQEIEGDFRLSNTDVGVHFANNPSLAENAAVKSAFERPAAAENIRSQEFVINAKPEQIVDIPASANRFDFYDILDSLYAEGRIDQGLFNDIFDGLESIEDLSTTGASMLQEQNKFFADSLSRNTDIRALRYMNEFDAGPTWRDFEQGQTTSSVAPDYSYIVLDPKFVTRPQNYRDGGQVMMRSDMSSQMEGGIGGLSDRARDMFVQHMSLGGPVGNPLDMYGAYLQQSYADPIMDRAEGAVEQFVDGVRQQEQQYFGSAAGGMQQSPMGLGGMQQSPMGLGAGQQSAMQQPSLPSGLNPNDPFDGMRGFGYDPLNQPGMLSVNDGFAERRAASQQQLPAGYTGGRNMGALSASPFNSVNQQQLGGLTGAPNIRPANAHARGAGAMMRSPFGLPIRGFNEGGSVGVSSDILDRLRQRIIRETGTDPFDIAREEGIDPDLMLRVIQQESSGNPNAQSEKGAFGYMQLMPGTAKELGVDRTDPVQNMRGGARYLRQQLDEFRTVPLALAAYNAGPTATRRYGAIPPFKETIKYVSRITGIPFTDPSLGQTRSQAAAELGIVRPMARPADLRDPRAAQEDQILQLLQQSMQGSQPQQMQPAPQQPQPQQNPNPIESSLRPIARPAQFGMPEGASPFAVQPPPVLPGARSILPQSVLRPIARPTGQ